MSKFVEILESVLLDEANTTVVNHKGKKVLYSYKTPVAVKDGDNIYVTDTKHSTTTAKHINAFVGDAKDKVVTKKQAHFDKTYGNLD
jgi:hypothetical protein